MALRQIEYEGVTITAAAFEVAGTGRFLVTLSIASGSGDDKQSDAELFDPPSPDGLFDSIEEALESAIAFGRSIVDGDNADQSSSDP
jgi:hypothetical protein